MDRHQLGHLQAATKGGGGGGGGKGRSGDDVFNENYGKETGGRVGGGKWLKGERRKIGGRLEGGEGRSEKTM